MWTVWWTEWTEKSFLRRPKSHENMHIKTVCKSHFALFALGTIYLPWLVCLLQAFVLLTLLTLWNGLGTAALGCAGLDSAGPGVWYLKVSTKLICTMILNQPCVGACKTLHITGRHWNRGFPIYWALLWFQNGHQMCLWSWVPGYMHWYPRPWRCRIRLWRRNSVWYSQQFRDGVA